MFYEGSKQWVTHSLAETPWFQFGIYRQRQLQLYTDKRQMSEGYDKLTRHQLSTDGTTERVEY